MRRLPAALLKRLERVEAMQGAGRPYAAFPPILAHDEWEALAVVSQENLVFLTREFIEVEPLQPEPEPDTKQADHREAYRKHQEQIDAGASEYLKRKRQQVQRLTTR